MTDSKQQTERTGSKSNSPSQTPTSTTRMSGTQQSDAKPTTGSSTSSNIMTDDPSYVTILGGAPSLFRRCSTEELNDVREEISPDAYFLTGSDESFNGMRQIEYSLSDSNPLFYPGGEHTGNEMTRQINGVDIIVCPDFDSVKRIKQYEANGTINTETETVVLSNLLSTKINMEDLSTTMEGLNKYTDALSPNELRGSYTHISGELPAGYCQEWGNMLVRGCGNEKNGSGEFLSLKITPTGVVTTEFIDGSSLGMQSIENVGPKTAERLQENGFGTKKEVAEAGVAELTSISGIGEATAESIQQSATALTENRIVPTSDSW